MSSPLDVLKKIVSVGAPILATALGTPLAGAAVAELSQVLFGTKNATVQQIQSELLTNPGDVIKIQEAENNFKIAMARANIDLATLNYADIKDARNMAIQSKGINSWMPAILAIFVTIGFFATIYILMLVDIDTDTKDALYMLVGILGTAWIQIISFFFGSSTGSKEKDLMTPRGKND